MPFPGRAEFWGEILASQAFWPGHLGIDNLGVVGSIGRLLDCGSLSEPFSLVEDGDLVAIIWHLILARGPDTVNFTKVKGHTAEADVDQGRVRLEDRIGNIEADAAELGRRRQPEEVMDVRWALLKVQDFWYPIMLQLHHRFMIAVSWVSVNHDGRAGTALDPLVWDREICSEQRNVDKRVNVHFSMLPGPPGFLNGPLVQVHGRCTTGADIAAWPVSACCVDSLLSEALCFGLLVLRIWGHMGFTYLENLILFEQWAGRRLLSEKVTRPHVRAHRLISISSVPVSEGVEVRQGCGFISSLVSSLGKLWSAGSVHALHGWRLRHLGWEQHGLKMVL